MKKSLLFLLIIILLCACSDDKTDMPRLELDGVFLNDGDKDYSRNLEDILPLSPGENMDVFFMLYGNGADLASFVVKSENENISTDISSYPESEVSDDFSQTGDMLRYKDGVRNSWVKVRLKAKSAKEEEARVAFYLNSKAPDSEGASCYLELRTTTQPRESNEE